MCLYSFKGVYKTEVMSYSCALIGLCFTLKMSLCVGYVFRAVLLCEVSRAGC